MHIELLSGVVMFSNQLHHTPSTLLVHLVSICMPSKPWPYSCLQSIPSRALSTTHFTHSSSHDAMLCMPSLCHLFVDCLACCLFLFLLSVFSCTALHWGGPLHPLPVPVCFPCTLLPCFHSVSCIIYLPSPPSSHSLAISGWFWLLWAGVMRHFRFARGALPRAPCPDSLSRLTAT